MGRHPNEPSDVTRQRSNHQDLSEQHKDYVDVCVCVCFYVRVIVLFRKPSKCTINEVSPVKIGSRGVSRCTEIMKKTKHEALSHTVGVLSTMTSDGVMTVLMDDDCVDG
jgi:hypothetical protein